MKLWYGLSMGLWALGFSSAAEAQWTPEYEPRFDGHEVYPYGEYDPGVAAFAGPWHQHASESCGGMAAEALRMAEQLQGAAGYEHVAGDALALADAARHFQQEVMRGGSREHHLDDFRAVRGAYRHLQEEFSQAHGLYRVRYLNDDWSAMARAYASALQALQIETRGRRREYRYGRPLRSAPPAHYGRPSRSAPPAYYGRPLRYAPPAYYGRPSRSAPPAYVLPRWQRRFF